MPKALLDPVCFSGSADKTGSLIHCTTWMSQGWQILSHAFLEGGRTTSLGSGAAGLQWKLCIPCEHVPGEIPLHLQLSPRRDNSISTLFYQPPTQAALWILLYQQKARKVVSLEYTTGPHWCFVQSKFSSP